MQVNGCSKTHEQSYNQIFKNVFKFLQVKLPLQNLIKILIQQSVSNYSNFVLFKQLTAKFFENC